MQMHYFAVLLLQGAVAVCQVVVHQSQPSRHTPCPASKHAAAATPSASCNKPGSIMGQIPSEATLQSTSCCAPPCSSPCCISRTRQHSPRPLCSVPATSPRHRWSAAPALRNWQLRRYAAALLATRAAACPRARPLPLPQSVDSLCRPALLTAPMILCGPVQGCAPSMVCCDAVRCGLLPAQRAVCRGPA